jgi:hypothetical protein
VQEFAITTGFGPNFPKDEKQFLDLMVITGKNKSNDCHQQSRQALSIQHKLNNLLQGCCLATIVKVL